MNNLSFTGELSHLLLHLVPISNNAHTWNWSSSFLITISILPSSISFQALAFSSSLAWLSWASFFSPLSQWWWTSHYSSNSHAMFDFHFSLDSPTASVYHLKILLEYVEKGYLYPHSKHIHQCAGQLTLQTNLGSIVNSSSFSFWQQHPVLHMPPLAPAALLQHRQALFQDPQWYISFLLSIAHLWLSHLSYPFFRFLEQHLHVSSYALMFYRWSPWTPTDISWKFFKFFEKHPDCDVY